MSRNIESELQQEREKQLAATEDLNVPQEVLKMYKLRKLIAAAWGPLGISRNEAADILTWAIGQDVAQLHFSLWPIRIMENTGIIFDSKQESIVSVLRQVADVWQKKKVKPITLGG